MIKLTSAENFFLDYACIYKKAFNFENSELSCVRDYKKRSEAQFYCLFDGLDLVAFFSLTPVGDDIFGLGDVVKVDFRFRREDFIDFLRSVVDQVAASGSSIVGFPNSKAIKLELGAGFQIIKYYVKQPLVFFGSLQLMLPLFLTPKGYSFMWRGFRIRTCTNSMMRTRRRLVMSSNRHLRTKVVLFGLSVEYRESQGVSNFPYISYKGKKSRLIRFCESDNSA